MLYPPLEEGHEVLGQEYCSGFSDVHGQWNTGFFCPPIIPDVPVFCCGTIILKYCCTLGKPLAGGHYSKGYDSRHTDQDEEEHDNDNTEDGHDERIIPEIPIQPSGGGEVDFNQKSLLIGIICGLVAMAALMTVVSCFYCSCCVLYKKRRDRQLGGEGLMYGIPTSSSSTTTCGLLNSFGNATPGSAAIITPANNASGGTSSGGVCSSTGVVNSTATLPNFISTSTPLNPLVDYWNNATGGGSSNSSSCGVASGGGASSTLIVSATATSLPPQNFVGGHAPHHIHHGSVYHHHHHYTTSSPLVGPPNNALSFLHNMDPPPPYLAVAPQQGGEAVPTPQRANSTGGGASQNANLIIQRQLSLLQNHHTANNNNISNNTTTSPGNNNNNPISSISTGPDGGSHGNSPSIAAVTTTSSPRTENANSRTGGRGSLPPPYFVEQYRIRNRVRPPPFPTNSESGTAPSTSNRNQRNRAQETIHNLLYPLLNSAALTSASSRHAHSEGRRRNTTATDTQSEPRRSHHHHHHHHAHHSHSSNNRNNTGGGGCSGGGPGLHRSSSDRQQFCGSARCCYMAGDRGEGVVAMNNLINNLSVRSGRTERTASGTSSTTTPPGRQTTFSAGGNRDIRRSSTTCSGHSGDGNDGNENYGGGGSVVDNLGKILNTQVLQQGHEREGRIRLNSRDYQNSSTSPPPPTTSITMSNFRCYPHNIRIEPSNTHVQSRLLSRFQHECEQSSNLGRDELLARSSTLNENERTLVATTEANDNADVDGDIIMMEDEEDEVIAVVTTAHHHQVADDEEEEEVVVDIMDDLGFGVEEYLVEDENSEENSIEKLSESAPNSSMSVSADATHSHHPPQNNGNDNSKRGTQSPSSFLAEGDGLAAGDDHDHHSTHKKQQQQTSDNSSESRGITDAPADATSVPGFVSKNDKES